MIVNNYIVKQKFFDIHMYIKYLNHLIVFNIILKDYILNNNKFNI